jgi:serine/threonine-protein kinase
MTSSQTGQKSSGAFAFPALPLISHRPETVVNPEGRGMDTPAQEPAVSQANSSVWQRLFPQALGSSDEDLGAPALSPEGFELGHFVLQERIGIGGMGAVFRALDTRLQRIVALKVLGPAQSRDEQSVKRFQNEASAAARLDHDNIARVYYIGEDHGLHFIAFEYITGTNLRDLIRDNGPVSPADAVN